MMHSIRPFRAFVSYCHADRDFAARLQRRLEAYRLPRRLAGRVVPLPGQGTGRIGPIFRDRNDLSAAADLSLAVRDAIAASSALLVVVSPDAMHSKWVLREIELFRELQPDAPILVAHARGEPETTLPAALRDGGIEPLAADFRREGDGARLAFLKIVAGLVGLPLDALVQRDAQRRLRRVTAITVGALVITLLMATTTVFALTSRAQAVHERRQAEGLIDFMLTDLRTKLRGVGRLDIMEEVDLRAWTYYTAQGDLSRLPDDSILLVAQILRARGEDDSDKGRLATALARFREAHHATETLLKRRPNDASRIFGHAQSEFWLGSAAVKVKEFEAARRHFERYAELARRLVAADPNNKDWRMEGAYAESNLGTLALWSEKRPDLAGAAFERASAHFLAARRLAPGDKGVVRDLADNHGWLADSFYDQRKFDRAHAERGREHALIEGLVRGDPLNANLARDLAESSIGMARAEIALGRRPEALARLRKTKPLVDQLWRRDPANKRTARLNATAALYLAELVVEKSPRSREAAALVAVALRACRTPGELKGTAEQKRLCERVRTRVNGVSTY